MGVEFVEESEHVRARVHMAGDALSEGPLGMQEEDNEEEDDKKVGVGLCVCVGVGACVQVVGEGWGSLSSPKWGSRMRLSGE